MKHGKHQDKCCRTEHENQHNQIKIKQETVEQIQDEHEKKGDNL